MLSKCYNRNNFVTNVNSGKNSYIVNSGTRKDITTPALIAHIQTREPQASCEQAASWKATSYKLKGEATMTSYMIEGISRDGHKVTECTCYTTREEAERAVALGDWLTKDNKTYVRIVEREA